MLEVLQRVGGTVADVELSYQLAKAGHGMVALDFLADLEADGLITSTLSFAITDAGRAALGHSA